MQRRPLRNMALEYIINNVGKNNKGNATRVAVRCKMLHMDMYSR